MLQEGGDRRSGGRSREESRPYEGGGASRPGRPRARRAVLLAAALLTVVLAGPRPRVRERWVEPRIGEDVEAYLAEREAAVPRLRPGEAKGVVWADRPGVATPLSLAYLHGFSADRHEVEPLVGELAAALGANAYFARLAGHGADGAALGEARAEEWLDDAAEAVAVGARIGRRVVLVGTSTGATLALWAASRPEARDRVAALVLVSPNLGVADRSAALLLWPWGGLVARAVVGPERCFEPASPAHALHWTTCYPTRALLPMMAVVEHVRGLPAGAVTVPVLVFASEDDQVVDAAESARVLQRLLAGRHERVDVHDAGDPQQHVLAGTILSPRTTSAVRERIEAFLATLAESR